jgi:para-nitrobenzyl esterase
MKAGNRNISTVKYVLSAALLAIIVSCATAGEAERETLSPYRLSRWDGTDTVQTRYGTVKGFKDEANTWVWKAIPYAQPPLGELRWKAPREPEPWKGIRRARRFSSMAVQYRLLFKRGVHGSEDCLYLNVWRPRTEDTDLPVYVWIHGGGNSIGSSAKYADYRGQNLADYANLIFVSVNYRLGPLGWFTHPALRNGENALDDSGNYGTLDIIQALKWIRENISAFGGDPDNVLVAGESAGGINVLSLLLSPEAGGLFHKAMAQSGGLITQPMEKADAKSREIILQLLMDDRRAADIEEAEALLSEMPNTEVAAYLRSQPADKFLRQYENIMVGMISFPYLFEDGTVIPKGGYDAFDSGSYNKIPLIIGGTKEEIKVFLMLQGAFPDRDDFYQQIARFGSEIWKAQGVDDVARRLRRQEEQPGIYVYRLDWGAPDLQGQSVLPKDYGLKIGASHGFDVPFFHGTDTIYGNAFRRLIITRENRPGMQALSRAVMTYLGNFLRTGNPNAPDPVPAEWEAWSNDAQAPKSILFDVSGDEPNIRMTSRELTVESVTDSMRSELSEELFEEAWEFITSGSGLSRLAEMHE